MKTIEVNGRSVKLDGEGYLQNFKDWEKDVAVVLAEAEKLELTEDHWTVVQLMRDYYAVHEAIPTARDFTRSMGDALGNEKGSSRYLSQLFPNEPMKQSGKVAGLPRMGGCT